MGDAAVSGKRRRTRRCARVIAGFVMFVAAATGPADTRALGRFEHPSAVESVTHARGILSGLWVMDTGGEDGPGTGGERPARYFVELSEQRLYGMSGLRVPGIRLGVRGKRVSLDAEAAQLASGIGCENRLALTPAYHAAGRWSASAGVVYESARVAGFAPAGKTALTVRSLVRLSENIALGGELDRYRVHGEPAEGADVGFSLLVRVVPAVIIRGVVKIDRWTGAQPSVSATFHALKVLSLSFGYEGQTGVLGGALSVRLRRVTCVLAECCHPVLGSRRGITLLWEG